MKKAEVKVDGYYTARVSGHVVPIWIVPFAWEARNLVTGRTVRIRSASRLRMEITEEKALELAESLRKIRRGAP